jgi:hypothetical protein
VPRMPHCHAPRKRCPGNAANGVFQVGGLIAFDYHDGNVNSGGSRAWPTGRLSGGTRYRGPVPDMEFLVENARFAFLILPARPPRGCAITQRNNRDNDECVIRAAYCYPQQGAGSLGKYTVSSFCQSEPKRAGDSSREQSDDADER